jgi:5-formyltetrahydrofolate cyclo-ligase
MGSPEKAELRRKCRKARESMSLERVLDSSQAVCAHLSDWHPFQQASVVLSYLAFGNEIDLMGLFENWPEKRWLVPRVVGGSELATGERPHLVVHPYDAERLVRHRFGMLEPERELPTIAPGDVQMVLVPGIAFDRTGGRLGYGGGFYDRLLPLANLALRVGVTYEELVLEAVPMQPWDRRVNWLVTPAGLTRVNDSD